MDTLPTTKLAELIRGKHQVLRQLRDVGLKQVELVDLGQVPSLLQLLAAKQHLITSLQAVERDLMPFRDEDPEARKWSSTEAREECARLAAECNELLNEVVYLEKQSEDKMVARRDQVASQLHQMHSAHQARGAYAANQSIPGAPHQERPQSNPPAIPVDQNDLSGGNLDLVSGS